MQNYHGIYIHYRSSGKVLIFAVLLQSKLFYTLVRALLYADDADLVGHTKEGLQCLIDCFDRSGDAFGLTLNQKKTVVMFLPACLGNLT